MLDVISKEFKNKEITSKAVFSKCFKFRYSITNKFNSGRGRLLFILLNPSTATEKVYDPTLLRCKKELFTLVLINLEFVIYLLTEQPNRKNFKKFLTLLVHTIMKF